MQSLRSATTYSDNSVYAQVGIKVGTGKIARLARRMGIRTPVSKNLAMTLGGLSQGVTPLDMAHAYETFAQRGRFTYGTMSPDAVDRKQLGVPTPGPVGIRKIGKPDDGKIKALELPNGELAQNETLDWPIVKQSVADQVASILSTVVGTGTGVRAQIPGTFVAGKTGTTENYGDAWFVGWTKELTVAVWVGYPDELRPMETEFNGEPVAGGTYPASIWKAFMDKARTYEGYGKEDPEDPEDPVAPPPAAPADPRHAPTPRRRRPRPRTARRPARAAAPSPRRRTRRPRSRLPSRRRPPSSSRRPSRTRRAAWPRPSSCRRPVPLTGGREARFEVALPASVASCARDPEINSQHVRSQRSGPSPSMRL